MTLVIAYDIENNRTRDKISRFLGKQGFRIQKSVFVMDMEKNDINKFLAKLKALAGDHDRVAVFRLCAACARNALALNMGEKSYYVF